MSNQEPQSEAFFTHIDVTAHPGKAEDSSEANAEISCLLQHLIAGQERTNELLEDLVQQTTAAQRQRANELGQWKEANPHLARKCRRAAESLSQVQTEFLNSLTEEIEDNSDGFVEGEFLLNEFVDRYGPRLAHLNGVLQVLSQLSTNNHSNFS